MPWRLTSIRVEEVQLHSLQIRYQIKGEVNFNTWLLIPRKEPRQNLSRMIGGAQSQYGEFAPTGFEFRIIQQYLSMDRKILGS
jgi:hypothetical protein